MPGNARRRPPAVTRLPGIGQRADYDPAMEPRRVRTAARGEQDQRTVSGDATRKRILKHAERLFAKQGIDAVSIRDITDAAGVNSAAIHYHFGSKSGLIEALLARWAGELVERRGKLLDRIEAQPKVALRDVVDVLVWPMIELGERAAAAVATWVSSLPS